MRAISLDARSSSPASIDISDIRIPSPSQSSLTSIPGCSASNICLQSPKLGRCLSPLLIPPRAAVGVETGCGPASPLGAIQPDLYTRQEGPICITASDSNQILGRLHLRIKYDYHLFDLTVHLIEGKICPPNNSNF